MELAKSLDNNQTMFSSTLNGKRGIADVAR